ncbi:helix-turn-helix domain-containing protein [Winogradskyella bathintestinalis]|uniref:AraC family transcriptional regulator n=1 Tax=Winogradskyella bathintestinalis TaxID=3035208 RepID=A0ABT7ZVQ8_9FLAO|nr:AraC family transcriptional regulator [Winogradskyella bathintestinalis]MDN3493095.1 AraC family transcriptional regulator [Winogradskyella bathintestinalis]
MAYFSHSQENDLIIKARELVYSDPDESIKIAKHLLNTSQHSQQKVLSNILISEAQIVKGNYHQAVIYAFDKHNLSESISENTQIDLNLLKAQLLRRIYLDEQAQKYLEIGQSLVEKLPQNTYKDSIRKLIRLEQIYTDINRRNNNKALRSIKDTEVEFGKFLKNNSIDKQALYFAKVRVYNKLSKHDSTKIYIEKTLGLVNTSSISNLYLKALIYKELGNLQLQQKEFKESEESLFIASKFAEILDNPMLLMGLNRDLSTNYLASGQNIKHKVFNDKYLTLNAEVERTEQLAVNTLYTMLSNQEEDVLNAEKQTHNNYLYLLIAGFVGVLVIGSYMVLKGEAKKKRHKEIISYLEIVRNNEIKTKPSKKARPKRIAIPQETEQLILSKLKRFESSKKFLNKDISLAVLAGQFDTNTKYLSGVINKHYDDNFNTFINKLRVNYVIDKLKNDSNYINYKISFLAEESGYSSHSSFATVFKSIVGMSPVTFIKLIQKERAELKKKNIT